MTDSHDGDERDPDASPSESRREESSTVDERTNVERVGGGETDGGRTAGDDGAAATVEPERAATGRDGASRGDAATPSPTEDPLEWFRTTDSELAIVFKDVASSVGIVIAIGLVLFAVSGVWPPMVAIESGSMNPHMQKGDLVFIMDDERLTPDEAVADTGIVTQEVGQETGYRTFGGYGDVIIFQPGGASETPIIHRAHLYVEEGENWYDRADKDHIRADNCQELRNCPAQYDGFITKGDNPQTNQYYDQANRHSIVRPEQIQGTAEVRIPWLGCIRLEFSGTASCRPVLG